MVIIGSLGLPKMKMTDMTATPKSLAVGPGLGLAGKAAISTFLPLVVAFFTAQILFSYFWMKTFAFGPAEWLWRTLTYKTIPSIRRTSVAPA